MHQPPVIAAVIPCHNEEVSVGRVISDLRIAVPDMRIYVYDNASTDRTAEVAIAGGATVSRCRHRTPAG